MPSPLECSAGWGYFPGDKGSGCSTGRRVIRAALQSRDAGTIHQAIAKYFDCHLIGGIISAVYDPSNSGASFAIDPTLCIAGLSPLVLAHAFSTSSTLIDEEALDIVKSAPLSAAGTVAVHLRNESLTAPLFKEGLWDRLLRSKNSFLMFCIRRYIFKPIWTVPDAAAFAAWWLVLDHPDTDECPIQTMYTIS